MKSTALRRYPALGFLGLAAALALMLPTALNVPLSNPSSSAEVAPVAGRSQQPGALSDLNGAASSGLGAGTGARSGADAGPAGRGRHDNQVASSTPPTKRCVGPVGNRRQTEDPLSPACIPFFAGDNGGATTRGVTRDEINVVIFLGASTTDIYIDYGTDFKATGSAAEDAFFPVVEALGRYFTNRYQLYDRKLHLFGFRGQADGNTPDQTRASVGKALSHWGVPFALVDLTNSPQGSAIVADETTSRKVLYVGYAGADRALQQERAPYLMTFTPDLQDQGRIFGSYVCSKIAGRPASFSGEPVKPARRKFGIVFVDEPAVEPQFGILKQLFTAALKDCDEADVPASPLHLDTATTDYGTNVLQMQQQNVTTVIVLGSSGSPQGWTTRAEAIGYHPEWLVPGATDGSGADANHSAQLYDGAQWRGAFGLTYDRRRGVRDQQPWFQAVKESCPSCNPPSDVRNAQVYDVLQLLLWGVQAAGPRVNPQSVDRGLHAIPARPSADPSVPAAYFAPGNWSFIKDAAEIWWDPSQTGPSETRPGCYHLVDAGRRRRANEWAGTPDRNGADPCQGTKQ